MPPHFLLCILGTHLLKLPEHLDGERGASWCLLPVGHESHMIVIIVSAHVLLLLQSGTRIAYVY